MTRIAYDTETFLINTRGKATTKVVPRLVCMSVAIEGEKPMLYERERAVHVFEALIARDDATFYGHNVMFDNLVMVRAVAEELGEERGKAAFRRIRDLYSEERILDTMLREMLYDNERGGRWRRGGYGLADLVKRRLGEKVTGKKGEDAWRMRYNELDGVPVSDYPQTAYDYALKDAEYTLRVAIDQDRHRPLNDAFQSASAFPLQLISAWGVNIDAERAALIDAWYARIENEALDRLKIHQIYVGGRVKQAAKKQLVADGFAALGEPPPLTPTGQIATSKKYLEELEKRGYEHPAFRALIDYNRSRKFRSTYLEPMLDAGEAGQPLCARYNTFVDTGRTSSSNPNMQNIVSRITPRERLALEWFESEHGKMSTKDRIAHPQGFAIGPDIRGCVVPRPGKVIIGADYSAIEMAGLAQVIKNWTGEVSNLGKSINAGEDQHLRVYASWKKVSYERAEELYNGGDCPLSVDFDRFLCKSANYGFAGGSSAATWQEYVGGMGAEIPLKTCEQVRAAWYSAWPEMYDYFDRIGAMKTPGGEYLVHQHGPGGVVYGWRTRLAPRYTSAANSLFQGIVGDGAKYSAWLLSEECYFNEDSALFSARPIIFEHDAFYLEVDSDRVEAAGELLTAKMVEGMSVFIPDIKVEADYEVYPERWGEKAKEAA